MTEIDELSATDSICVGCGICCDGTLFRTAALLDSDDTVPLESAKVTLVTRPSGERAISLPCSAFKEKCCSIYDVRPHICRAYKCQLLQGYEAGDVSYEDASDLIAATLALRDLVKPVLVRLLAVDERAALEELFRLMLARFEMGSPFARPLPRRADLSATPDDLMDVLPMTEPASRLSLLAGGGTAGELAVRQADLLRRYHFATAADPAGDRDGILAERASVSHHLGDFDMARSLGVELVDLRTATLGPHHQDTLDARECVAVWTGQAGNPMRARVLHEELLADRRRVLGETHDSTLGSRHEIVDWTGLCGEPEEALRLGLELLADEIRMRGADHPGTLALRHSVAYWTGAIGEAAVAPSLYADLLADRHRVLGGDHPDTLATRSAVAYWTGVEGDPQAACDLASELLLDQVRILGVDHPDTIAAGRAAAFWSRQREPSGP